MPSQTHITLPIEQFNLLLGELRDLKTEVSNIGAKTDNIHRIFNKVDEEPKRKKLSLKQKRVKAFKDAIEKEDAELIRQINQM